MTKISNLFTFLLLFCITGINAQIAPSPPVGGNGVEMASDNYRNDFTSSGKIYVVVSVVLIILVGLLIYVASIDRKISKLEKEIKLKK